MDRKTGHYFIQRRKGKRAKKIHQIIFPFSIKARRTIINKNFSHIPSTTHQNLLEKHILFSALTHLDRSQKY